MLNAMRRGAQTWVAKLLFGILVLSFGVWGISGSLLSGTGDSVVTVGDTEVSPNEFRLAYDRQLSLLSQQFGTRLTREQARAFGVEDQVYAQLVAGAALDELADDMNLGLSESRLASLIAEDPAFQGIDGEFSRQNFAYVLNQVGMSQDDYIRNREQVAVRTQVIEALSDGFDAPQTMIDALSRHRAEARTVNYVLVDESMIEPVGTPDDETLQAYFEENQDRYRAPEYRQIAYVALTAQSLADPETISEEEVRAEFEANAADYSTPERRTIEQLIFPDQEAAEAAAQRLSEGETFDAIAAEQGRTVEDTRLGTFTREEMSNETLAEAAFSIQEAGGTSGVVDGPFGPVILRVSSIEEGGTEQFDEVSDEIRQHLAEAEAADLLFDVYDSYEDARAGGMSLQEAAREQRLEPVTITVDQSGRTPDGEVVEDIPASRELLAAAFQSDVGIEEPAISIGSDGYVWFEVLDIEEARDRTLDEVRDQVIEDWRGEEVAAALSARAEELEARLRDGGSLQAIAEELGTRMQTEYGLQRNSDDPIFGGEAVEAAFAGPRGHIALAPTAEGDGRLLMQVAEVATAAGQSLPEQEREAVSAQTSVGILDELVTRLQREYPVSINRSLGEQALAF